MDECRAWKKNPRVTQERQILLRIRTRIARRDVHCSLIDLVCGEVRGVGDGSKVRDEWGIDVANSGPVDTVEELGVSAHHESIIEDQSGKSRKGERTGCDLSCSTVKRLSASHSIL